MLQRGGCIYRGIHILSEKYVWIAICQMSLPDSRRRTDWQQHVASTGPYCEIFYEDQIIADRVVPTSDRLSRKSLSLGRVEKKGMLLHRFDGLTRASPPSQPVSTCPMIHTIQSLNQSWQGWQGNAPRSPLSSASCNSSVKNLRFPEVSGLLMLKQLKTFDLLE